MRKIVIKRMFEKSWRPLTLGAAVVAYMQLASHYVGDAFALLSFLGAVIVFSIVTGYKWAAEDVDMEQEKMLRELGKKND